MKKENIVGVSLFVIVLIVFGLYQTNKEKNLFKSKGLLTIGTVLKVEDDYKEVPDVYYSYIVEDKTYQGKTSYPEFKGNIEGQLINKKFSVIYIKDKPNESHILISRIKFKNYDMNYPDSLLWTAKLEMH